MYFFRIQNIPPSVSDDTLTNYSEVVLPEGTQLIFRPDHCPSIAVLKLDHIVTPEGNILSLMPSSYSSAFSTLFRIGLEPFLVVFFPGKGRDSLKK